MNTPDLVKAAADAGAKFLVSPGWTDTLLDAMAGSGLPALPGAGGDWSRVESLARAASALR